jgi:hypothetical protein
VIGVELKEAHFVAAAHRDLKEGTWRFPGQGKQSGRWELPTHRPDRLHF